MIRRWGRIVALDGEAATVALRAACQGCAGAGCAISLKGSHVTRIEVQRRSDWQVGQRVMVEISSVHLLQLAVIGYGLPLLGLWIGLLVGAQSSDLVAGAMGLAGLVIALYSGRHLRQQARPFRSIQAVSE